MTHESMRALMLGYPGVQEAPCYGTPGFRVRRKLLARFHQDGESLVIRTDFHTRDFLLRHRADVFHLTDHYRDHPWVLVRIAEASEAELREHFEEAWRRSAPKRMVAAHDTETGRRGA